MGVKDLAAKTASVTGRAVDKGAEKEPRSAPVKLYDMTARMHAAEQKAEELQHALNEAVQGGELRELPLSDLHEVPGRRRTLTPVQYNDLKENLTHNEIIDAIKVSPREAGGWDIVSGNNKTAIMRELGRETVLCRIQNLDKVEADIQAFNANLFQTTLPDYEKYLGFKMLMKVHDGMRQVDLVKRTGKSKSVISELLSFDDLPPAVHEMLRLQPQLIGQRAAAQLAAQARNGLENEVIEAVCAIATKGIDQAAAVQMVVAAAGRKTAPPAREKPLPVTIRSGRTTYCSVVLASKVLRIEFATKEEATAVEEAIRTVLQNRADQAKTK